MSETSSSSVATRLRSAREHAGLSQGQVAKLLNMHRPTISEIEAGRRRITALELAEFAKLYEVSISWLSGEDDDGLSSDRVRLAARDLAKLRDEDLDKVMRLLSSLRSERRR